MDNNTAINTNNSTTDTITNNNQQVTDNKPTISTDDITVTDNGGTKIATLDNSASADNVDSIDINNIQKTQQQQGDNTIDDNSPAQVQAAIDNQLKAEQDLKADLSSKGVDFDSLAKEFEDNGELSKESLDKLAKAGYPKSVVDAYINGMQAVSDRFVSNVMNMAGGEEGYKQLVNFIKGQPKSVIDSFNATIEGGNLGQIELAINGLMAQMQRAYGTANPTVMARQTGNAQSSNGYSDKMEMVKDMSDPRYGRDKRFTEMVYTKVANSNF